MKKIVWTSFPLILMGCTTLDSSSDFTDAVSHVESKQNYRLIVGKSLTPDTKEIRGGQLVRSSLKLNYVDSNNKQSAPDSFITMELQYFKNYNEFTYAVVNGTKVEVIPYAATAETCSDVCTTTQYLKFPVSTAGLVKKPNSDLQFEVLSSHVNSFTFSIPAGYIEAIVQTGEQSVQSIPNAAVAPAAVSNAVEIKTSKPLEMMEYWYDESSEQVKGQFEDWAFANRQGDISAFETTEQSGQMLEYWFKKSSESERKQIIKWLLEQ